MIEKVDNNSLIDTWLPYKKRMFQSWLGFKKLFSHFMQAKGLEAISEWLNGFRIDFFF